MNFTKKLLFVYNANSGTFNLLADIGHKILSPDTYSCSLCAVTHGIFKEKQQWRSFVESLPIECVFLHRDEFLQQYPDNREPLPCVFLSNEAKLASCLSAQQLHACQNMQDLQQLISINCVNLPED
jgi:hypothetical protein